MLTLKHKILIMKSNLNNKISTNLTLKHKILIMKSNLNNKISTNLTLKHKMLAYKTKISTKIDYFLQVKKNSMIIIDLTTYLTFDGYTTTINHCIDKRAFYYRKTCRLSRNHFQQVILTS